MGQNIKKGFTLMESLIALTITGGAVGMVISNSAEQNEKEAGMKLIQEMNQVINAIDHRIAIDGYNPDSWGGKDNWKNISEVSDKLINEQLNSVDSKCPGGKWEPSMSSEDNTQLLPCNLWSGIKNRLGGDLSAEMNVDSVGYIQSFDLYFNFNNEEAFTKYFQGIKKGMKYYEIKDKRELSGSHFISLVKKSDKDEVINTSECIGLKDACVVKATFDRSGGNEYIRADGTNSMIASHLTFVEAKEEKDPLKCIRWENTSVNDIAAWKSEEVNCGIGIYNKDNTPVLVDTVTDSGTFNSVVLDKECKVLKWNEGTKKVEDTGKVSACGMFKNKDDLDSGTLSTIAVYQVVDNVIAEEGTFNILNAAIGNIESITADTINTSVLEVMNELNVNGKAEFNDLVKINSDLNVSGKTTTKGLTVTGDTNLNNLTAIGDTNLNNLTTTGNTNVNNLTSTGTTNLNNVTINDLEVTGETNLNTVNITGDLIVDGSIEGEFGDLDQRFTQIESIIEDINGRVTNNESNIHTNASNISKLEKRVEVNEKNIEILFNELNSAQPPEPDIELVQKWVKVDKRTDTGGCTAYGTKPAGDECAIVGERVYTKKIVGTQGNYCKLEIQYWSCQLVEVKVD